MIKGKYWDILTVWHYNLFWNILEFEIDILEDSYCKVLYKVILLGRVQKSKSWYRYHKTPQYLVIIG